MIKPFLIEIWIVNNAFSLNSIDDANAFIPTNDSILIQNDFRSDGQVNYLFMFLENKFISIFVYLVGGSIWKWCIVRRQNDVNPSEHSLSQYCFWAYIGYTV